MVGHAVPVVRGERVSVVEFVRTGKAMACR
jgi:hypothetical protein